MKVHGVAVPAPGVVATRVTSCYKECCLSREGKWLLQCHGWTRKTLFESESDSAFDSDDDMPLVNMQTQRIPPQPTVADAESDDEDDEDDEYEEEDYLPLATLAILQNAQQPINPPTELEPGVWVTVMYGAKWYVAQVLGLADDGGWLVKCTTPGYKATCTNTFKWPGKEDPFTAQEEDILQIVVAATEVANKKMQLREEDVTTTIERYEDYVGPVHYA